jgi:hypothetical protein
MTFAQYGILLQSACQQYDSAQRSHVRSRRPTVTRRVYMHDFDDSYTNDDNGRDDHSFDIDTPVDVINAFAATQTKHLPGSRLNFKVWNNLTPGDKLIWDQLSDATKALILSSTSGTSSLAPNTPSTTSLPSKRNGFARQNPRSYRSLVNTQRMVNLHDISAHDYLASLHELEHDHYDDNIHCTDDNDAFHDTQQDADDDQQDRILAHVTQREQLSPSDIKRIMSPSMA